MLPQFTLFRTIFLVFWEKTHWSIWKWKLLSCVQLFVTPWIIQSMEFFRPAYWSGQSFASPGGLPNSGIKSRSSTLQADYLPTEPQGKPMNTEWVAYPFFSGSSWHRNWTGVSWIAGRFFTNWVMREALKYLSAWTKRVNKWWENKQRESRYTNWLISSVSDIHSIYFWSKH